MSSVTNPIGRNLFSLEYAKRNLNIESDLQDSKIQELIFEVAQEINERLRPYAEDVPLGTGTPVFVQAQKTGVYYLRHLWFESLSQLAKAKYNMEIYEQKMAILIKAIISEKTDRTKAVFIPATDPRDVIFQPANKDEWITKVFN